MVPEPVTRDISLAAIGSLLKEGLEPAGEASTEVFESVLEQANVPDTQWRLGNYEVLEEIGRGGMGVIYRARQRFSRRIVALKRVLAYQADSHETLARFRREAEAAASLDHPNILPIYEVGETEDGVPFFSMKLAVGGSLRTAAASLRDNPRACVQLMSKAARAVDSAHAQGILHRDLQPGNILLDASGEPLVSDFGLAKWLDRESDLTQTLTTFGTPGYIAPEQAEGGHFSPAADIYSLGAILFNLLAGRPPFVGTNALSVIRQAAVAPAPRLRAFAPALGRDIETIVARCLERDPKTRYRSAAALAEDLERWLESRRIVARPVLPPVRIWRWSKRNPKLAAATATAVLSLIAAMSTFFWHRAVLANEVAKIRQGIFEYPQLEARLRASRGKKEREGVQEQAYAQLGQKLEIDPKILRQQLPAIAEQLKHSPDASSYERANAAYTANDYLEAERLALKAADEARQSGSVPETIKALELAGFSAQRQIEYGRAMQRFREAEKVADRERTPLEWAQVKQAIAELLHDDGKDKESEQVLRDVIELRLRLLGPGHPDSLTSRNSLANVLTDEGKYPEAEATFRDVINLREKLVGPEDPDTLASRHGLAWVLDKQGKYVESEAENRSVLGLREKVLGPEHLDTSRSRNNLAGSLYHEGKLADAEAEFRAVIKLREKVFGPEHPDTLKSRSNLAACLTEQGKYVQAEAETRALINLKEKVLGPEHTDTLLSRINLVAILKDLGKYAEDEAESRAAVTLSEKVLGREHPSTLYVRAYLADSLNDQGKYGESEAEFREVVTLCEKVVGPEHPQTLGTRTNLAANLKDQGKFAEAEAESRAVIKLSEKVFGPEHGQTVWGREVLADALAGQGKYTEAEREYGDAIRIRTKSAGPEHPDTLKSRSHLARTLMAEGKDADAEMRQVIQLREKVIGPEHPDTLESCYDLAFGLERQGKNQEAQEFARRAAEGARKVFGPNHPSTIKYEKLATDLVEQSRRTTQG